MTVPKEFFAALWGDAEGLAEIRCFAKGGSIGPRDWFAYPKDLDAFTAFAEQQTGKYNVYFGVSLRSRRGGEKVDCKAANCLWLDIDKEPKQGAEKLKKFPLRASLGVYSGRPETGIHAYWVMKEPAEGTEELEKTEKFNRALAKYFGGDPAVTHYGAVMRVPGTLNVKYDPPQPVKVVVFHPERQYTFLDFEEFLDFEPEPTTSSGPSIPRGDERPIPVDLSKKLANLLSEIWDPGYRNRLAMYVSGILAHAGYDQDSASTLIGAVCSLAHDEEAKSRQITIDGTYKKFHDEEKVAGGPALEHMILEEFPGGVGVKAKKIFEVVKKSIKEETKKGRPTASANFVLKNLAKVDSRPARYIVEMKMIDGAEIRVDVTGTHDFLNFQRFREHAYEQSTRLLKCRPELWNDMLDGFKMKHKLIEAPAEASLSGILHGALEEFLEDRRENPDHGLTKSIPGYDEDHIFFRLSAFKTFIKNKSVSATQQQVSHFLRDQGWKDQMKRLGKATARVWYRKLQSNGQQEIFGRDP